MSLWHDLLTRQTGGPTPVLIGSLANGAPMTTFRDVYEQMKGAKT